MPLKGSTTAAEEEEVIDEKPLPFAPPLFALRFPVAEIDTAFPPPSCCCLPAAAEAPRGIALS